MNGEDQCWICYDGPREEKLIKPCECKGSLEFVHETCLSAWLKHSTYDGVCGVCHHDYNHKAFLTGCPTDSQWFKDECIKKIQEALRTGFTDIWFYNFLEFVTDALNNKVCRCRLRELCDALQSAIVQRWKSMCPNFPREELNGRSPNFWVENWEEAFFEHLLLYINPEEIKIWKGHWTSGHPYHSTFHDLEHLCFWSTHIEEMLRINLLILPCMEVEEDECTCLIGCYLLDRE